MVVVFPTRVVVRPANGQGSAVRAALAQAGLEQTVTVDPSGNDERQSIQAAIDNVVPDNPQVRWAVLVYAGTYAEAIVVNNLKENVDIIGVDADAVVIDTTSLALPNTNGITIKGVGARHNSIRNLTIMTNDAAAAGGNGIVIAKEGTGRIRATFRSAGSGSPVEATTATASWSPRRRATSISETFPSPARGPRAAGFGARSP